MWFLNRIIFKLGNESQNLWIMLEEREKRLPTKDLVFDCYLAQSYSLPGLQSKYLTLEN